MNTKLCRTCNTTKSLEKFSNSKQNKNGKYSNCKQCKNKNFKKWYSKNKDKVEKRKKDYRKKFKKEIKEYNLLKRYNITLEQYNKMILEQDGKCAICKRKPKKFQVDHNHKTNNVRKLLCNMCNLALGAFDDNIVYLKSAINYLENTQ